VLTLITALMGAVALTALAGARRTETAVARFLQYAGPLAGQVQTDPATMDKIAALPDVAYTERAAMMLAIPMSVDGRPSAAPGQSSVITEATVYRPPQTRGIILAGRVPLQSRADEVMLNESAARQLYAHAGSVLRMAGYRPDEIQQVMNGTVLPPDVQLGNVQVTGIIRLPTDLTDDLDAPGDVTYMGQGDIIATAAFYREHAAAVGNFPGISFQLKSGVGIAAFEAQVKHIAGDRAQVELGDDAVAAGAFAQRGTSVEALALLLFGVIVALAMLVVVGQSLARQVHAAAADFPALRALGAAPRQLAAAALAPAALVAAAGMALAIPVAYGLSVFTPIGLARRAEVSPGLAFDAAALLGGAIVLALLLAGRAALSAPRAVRAGARGTATAVPGARMAGRLTGRRLPPTAVLGIRLAFQPGRGRAAVPVRSAIVGMTAAVAAVLTALVFGSSLSHVIGDPAVTGWNWDVTVGNPHSGDVSAQAVPRLRADEFVRLKQQFPGTVLHAVPPPEVRDLSGVSDLPLVLALVLMLLACGIIAHTLVTSVRRRRRELAVLKTLGFVAWQVRATVAWQATAIATVSLIVALPLGLAAGRWAWTLLAGQVAIVPAAVISPLTLLAFPAVLVLANAIAAIPGRAAARTQPAVVLRTE
jgi:hypothetical protein